MDKIADLLSQLAAKLGTTVEYLWPKLVARTKYEWLGEMAASLIVLGIGLYCARIAITAWRERVIEVKDRWGDVNRTVADIDAFFSVLAVIFCLAGLLFTLMNICNISQFLSPEASTILDLISRLKR